MSTTIESLELQIKSDSSRAVSGIDALSASLAKLKTATGGGLGLSSIATQINKVSTAANSVNGTTTNNLNNLAISLNKLSTLNNVKISSSLANQITALGTASKSLSGMSFSGIRDLGVAINSLNGTGDGKALASIFKQLEKIPKLRTNINPHITSFANGLKQLSQALKPLANELNIVGNAFEKLPAKMKDIVGATNKVKTGMEQYNAAMRKVKNSNSAAERSFIDFAAKIRSAYTIASKVIGTIGKFVTESNAYVENLNLFTASMGEYAQEAQRYADVVGDALGIDPSEWMRNQGVFNTIISGFGVASDKAYIMSKNLTQLGYDISSFFNISFADSMQKLQSGIAGELEPLRRLGYDLSVARLQQEAYNLGINKSVNNMNQAEKSMLRYHAIMNQVSVSHGDMARTINAPANQLRILQAQFTQCARAIGNIFIPMLNAILPVAIAVVKVLRMVAQAIANFFGFSLPEVDYSGISAGASAAGDLADNAKDAGGGLGKAAKEAKKLKNYMLGIDELNVIQPPEDPSASGGGAGGGGGGGLDGSMFDFPLDGYNFLDGLNDKFDKLTETVKKLLPVLASLAGGLLLNGALQKLAKALGKVLTPLAKFAVAAGSIMTVAGAILYLWGVIDMKKNGANLSNMAKLLGGITLAVGGLLTALTPILGFKWATVAAGIAGVAMSFGGLIAVGNSIKEFGTNTASLVGSLGLIVTASGSAALALARFGPVASGVGAAITAILGSLLAFKNFLYDIYVNGPNTQNAIGAIGSAIIALGAAVAIGFAVNPLMGFVAVIGTVALALGAVSLAASEAGKAAWESSDQYQALQERLAETEWYASQAETRMEGLKTATENLSKTATEFASAKALTNEIFDLAEKSNLSNYQVAILQEKIAQLNAMNIDGIQLEYDELTGTINQTRQEVLALIEDELREIQTAAMREVAIQAYKDQATATKDVADAEKSLKKTQDELAKAQKILAGHTKELKDEYGNVVTTITDWTREGQEAKAKVKELSEAIIEQQGHLDTVRGSLDASQVAYAQYSLEVLALQGQFDSFDITDFENTIKGLPGMVTENGNLSEAGYEVVQGLITSLQENGQLVPPALLELAEQLKTSFTEPLEINSPSKVFYTYGMNIIEGLNNGVSDNSDTTNEPITSWKDNIISWFTGGEGINSETWDSFGQNIIKGFKDRIGISYTDTKSNTDTWGSKVKEWYTNHVNKKNWDTYGSDIIGAFKSRIGSSYTDTKENTTTWGTKVKEWYTEHVNKTNWEGFGKDIIDAFKDKISRSHTDAKGPMTTFGSSVKDWFENPGGGSLVSQFTSIGSNIIQGFINGVNSLWSSAMTKIRSFGQSVIAEGKKGTQEKSPSRAFIEIGAYVVKGFNIGIDKMMPETFKVMDEWMDGINSYTPSIDLDTSALNYYQPKDFKQSVTAEVQRSYNATVSADSMVDALNEFYNQTMRPTMEEMAGDMKRQADKPEQTSVNLDGRALTRVISSQQRVNGYSFVRG